MAVGVLQAKYDSDGIWLPSLLLLALVGRMVLSASVGLSVDESYSVAVGREFSLSYFDHPPMHLWMAGAVFRLTGSSAGWAVRLPFELLAVGSTLLLYQLSRMTYGPTAARFSVLAYTLSPFFSIGVSGWVLPDGPLVAAALGMVVLFRRVLDTDSLVGWLAVGFVAGLGLLSKYLMVFPIVGCFLFLAIQHPRRLATPGPWLGFVCAVLVFSPVLIWNAQHAWASFAFQGGRAEFEGWHPVRALGLLAAGMAYVGVPSAVLGLRWLATRVRAGGIAVADVWFACLAVPALLAFSAISVWGKVLPHWALIGWLFLFPPIGHWLADAVARGRRPRYWGVSAAGCFLLIAGLAVAQGRWGVLDSVVPGYPRNDPLTEVLDWRELPTELRRRGLLNEAAVVAVESFVDAGKVDYVLGGTVPVICLCDDPHHYGIWHPPEQYATRTVLIVANARRSDWKQRAERYFAVVNPLEGVDIRRNGRVAVRLNLAIGVNLGAPAAQ